MSNLAYSIYHSPVKFIRTLLDPGDDANAPAGDGFPLLIAALCCTRAPGTVSRADVYEIVRRVL